MTENSLSWIMFSLMIVGITSLVFLGFQTEYQLIKPISTKQSWSSDLSAFIHVTLLIIISIGVFIGRFIRLNSISVFTDPLKVLTTFTQLFSLKSVVFILLFSFVQFILYRLATVSNPVFEQNHS